ncbi:MAG: hypothetical protein PHV02_18740 [Rhodocyclaceae bacterium]|nr:hypothetical protein [Rhodocyclaceae bacterium]
MGEAYIGIFPAAMVDALIVCPWVAQILRHLREEPRSIELSDEGDNHLVELAIAGGAEFIVTLNLRDLQRMELRFPQLKVVSPEDFLKELQP